jgi:hypothetical protein
MTLAEAIARDLPFEIEIPGCAQPYPLAWLWELRTGGIAFIFPGYRMSPSAESHATHGTVEQIDREDAWRVTDNERTVEDGSPLVVTLRTVRAHPPVRGTGEEALRYFRFWHDQLPKDSVISGTRKG